MTNSRRKTPLLLLALALLAFTYGEVSSIAQSNSREQDQEGIEKLHQQDIAATLAGDPKALAELWTNDAVRLEPGPAEVGRKLITAHDSEQKIAHPEFKILTYAPQIQDIKIVNGWAFEWGFFTSSYRDSMIGPTKSLRGKLLRVLEKQHDGSWKFARVMWNLAE